MHPPSSLYDGACLKSWSLEAQPVIQNLTLMLSVPWVTWLLVTIDNYTLMQGLNKSLGPSCSTYGNKCKLSWNNLGRVNLLLYLGTDCAPQNTSKQLRESDFFSSGPYNIIINHVLKFLQGLSVDLDEMHTCKVSLRTMSPWKVRCRNVLNPNNSESYISQN